MGMLEKISHIGSVIAEFQLLISRVASLSACSSVFQLLMLKYGFVLVSREKDYRSVFFFDFLVECFPEKVLQFLYAFLCE